VRPSSCERCGAPDPEGCHPDLEADPLEVQWLCLHCHEREHLAAVWDDDAPEKLRMRSEASLAIKRRAQGLTKLRHDATEALKAGDNREARRIFDMTSRMARQLEMALLGPEIEAEQRAKRRSEAARKGGIASGRARRARAIFHMMQRPGTRPALASRATPSEASQLSISLSISAINTDAPRPSTTGDSRMLESIGRSFSAALSLDK
jgi:hypothetical protein